MASSYRNIPRPLRIYLDVTNSCPLNCIHCFANAKEMNSNEFALSELKNLILQITEMGVKNLIISGGEPLSRADIFDFLSFCSDRTLNTTLLTNGILIDFAKSKVLNDLNTEVRVSIDGISKQNHDYIRGKGNFETVLQALNNLKRAKIKKLSIHFTVNRTNINDILLLPYFLNKMSIRDVVISSIKPVGRALEHPEILIEPSLVLLVKERLNTIYKNKLINFHKYEDKNWEGLGCPAAYTKCGITAEGRITPCIFLGKDFEGGNVRDFSLQYLWSNDTMLTKLRNLFPRSSCSQCSEINIFNGGCRALAKYFNRDIEAADPYCCEQKKQKDFQSILS